MIKYLLSNKYSVNTMNMGAVTFSAAPVLILVFISSDSQSNLCIVIPSRKWKELLYHIVRFQRRLYPPTCMGPQWFSELLRALQSLPTNGKSFLYFSIFVSEADL